MSESEVNTICVKYGIRNWSLNEETGLVDVVDDVYLFGKNLTELPLNFGNVNGYFYCNNNNLTTLKGAPISVGRNFCCYKNKISNRQNLPNVVFSIFCDKTTKWIF